MLKYYKILIITRKLLLYILGDNFKYLLIDIFELL